MDSIYKVTFNDRVLKKCMDGVPEMDSLEEIIISIKKYLHSIELSGINVRVEIDKDNYLVNIKK